MALSVNGTRLRAVQSRNMNSFCQYLDWDSNFFGVRIARLTTSRLTDEIIDNTRQWCTANHIDCLYFLADAADAATIRLAEDNHFRFVDIRMTFEKPITNDLAAKERMTKSKIRQVIPEDIPALRQIAKTSYRGTRFYNDTKFLTDLSDTLYETWIEKSCNGYADAVFVAEIHGEPAGYISCHLSDPSTGQIGLIAVDEKRRGLQLGQELITEALHWFAAQDITNVTVVTQGQNHLALRLYQRCGFLTSSVQLWYHRWFTQ